MMKMVKFYDDIVNKDLNTKYSVDVQENIKW